MCGREGGVAGSLDPYLMGYVIEGTSDLPQRVRREFFRSLQFQAKKS